MTTWCDRETAVQAVASGNRIFVQGACSTPTPLIEALVARGETLSNVEIVHLHTYGPTPYTDECWRGHFSLRALFVGENVRQAANTGAPAIRLSFWRMFPRSLLLVGRCPLMWLLCMFPHLTRMA